MCKIGRVNFSKSLFRPITLNVKRYSDPFFFLLLLTTTSYNSRCILHLSILDYICVSVRKRLSRERSAHLSKLLSYTLKCHFLLELLIDISHRANHVKCIRALVIVCEITHRYNKLLRAFFQLKFKCLSGSCDRCRSYVTIMSVAYGKFLSRR